MKKNRFVPMLGLFCAFLSTASPLFAQTLAFTDTTLPAGSGPLTVLPVDIKGDGHLDLVCANFGFRYGVAGEGGADGSTLTVYTNNGHGILSSNATLNVGLEPGAVISADINGDGHVDLINANFGDDSITVLTNNGHGIFTSNATYSVGQGPGAVVAADVNGDGHVDLITANSSDSTLTILTNNGHGLFVLSTNLSPGPGLGVVIAADVNGDGKMDLVCGYNDGSVLTILTNNGRGVFTLSANVPVGVGPASVVAADINGDGKVDLISANSGDFSVTILTNNGKGIFSLKASLAVFAPSTLVAADMNGDGKIDLVFGNSDNGYTGTVTVLTNDGHGNFSTNAVLPEGVSSVVNYPDCLAVADFNGDGKPDIMVANYGTATLTQLTQTASQTTSNGTGAAPVVTLTGPTNGAAFSTSEGFLFKATARSAKAIGAVNFYADGALLGTKTDAPYSLQVTAGALSPGGHNLQAIAVTRAGVNGSSATTHITINAPGVSLIDFDALNATAGAVSGVPLRHYLAWYGVTLAGVTGGTAMQAENINSLTGSIQVAPSSPPNFFTQAGLDKPISFTLRFATPLQSFGFTRAGLSSSSGGVSHPQWMATLFDTNGTALGSQTEALIQSASPVPARSFVLTGNGIASVRFDSDSQKVAAFSGVLLDDLILNRNPTTSPLSVALSVVSPPVNDIAAPATITLSAAVTDEVSSSYYVSFSSRAAEFGTVSNSPYQITLTNVLPGAYYLRARVVDSSGLAAPSAIIPITVQLEPHSTLVNFDALNAAPAPVEGVPVKNYLKDFGITIASLTKGTALTVDRQQHIAGGQAVLTASPPNLLTQTGSKGPVQFTLNFAPLLTQFGFTRPELLANPFVSHPAWQVTALDSSGAVVDQVAEAEIDSTINVGAREFALGGGGGPGIAQVQFASQGSGLTTFNGMLLDNFILTTNTSGFPPAVAITKPVSGLVLAAPPAVTITADASDAKGVANVGFYANGALIKTDAAPPYSINWKNPPVGNYDLTAVAVNVLGLAWTSAVVSLTIEPPAQEFGIVSGPASQTVALGGSVTFSVVTTGSNNTYQWYHSGVVISGATSSTLVLPPPIQDNEAGNYRVIVTGSDGTQLSARAVLTVVDPPTFTLQPAGQTVPTGANVTMNVAATGGGPFTWQWLLNGSRIAGATNSVYAIAAAQPLHSGNYQVTVANAAASAISAVAPLVVQAVTAIPETNDDFANRAGINPLLGPVSDSNVSATLEPGEPLPDGKTGGKSIWFTWRPTFTGTVSLTTEGSDFDTLLAVYTGTTLRKLKAVAADDDSGGFFTSLVTFNVTAGTDYQIDVDGFQGASGRVVLGLPAGTGYRILSPSSGDSVPVILKGPVSRVVAPGATVVLSVQVRSATPSTCQWNFQGAPIAGATASTLVIPHFQAASVGLYDVLIANSVGSAQSEPADLEISTHQGGIATSTENKFIDATNSQNFLTKLSIVLHPLSLGGDTGGFSVSQVFSTVGATTEPGQPEACGQVGGASQWFVYTAPATGMMQVNAAGSDFNTILGVFTGSGASFADLTEIGCGYATNYLAQGQPSVVLPAVTKGTTYYILIDGYQGQSGVAQLHIGLGQPPSFSTLPASQTVTAGSKATFKTASIGSTPAFYQWQLNGADIPGATKSTYTIPITQDDSIGNYTVVVSNVVGVITNSPPAALNLQYAPAIIAGPSNETVILGQLARFIVETMGVNVRTNAFVYQWYFDGAPVPRANSSHLAFTTRWTNSGSYTLVVSNAYGSVTSSPATLTVLDKTKPTVVIKTPPNNLVTNGGLVTITGTATDNVGIAQAQVQVNTGSFLPATGSNNWSISVTLQSGVNVISARSMDLSSNLSAVVKHNIAYNPAGPNSLSQVAGTYSGLFYPTNGVTVANSGFLTVTLASRSPGDFTANLLLDGGGYSFAGKFDSSGDSRSVVPRAGKTPVTVFLHWDDPMTGVISNADWRSILRAGRSIAASAPDDAGRFVLVTPSDTNMPVGYLNITNTPAGTVRVTGALADGASLFRAAPVTRGAAIPLYVPLYTGHGLFLGWITLTNPPAAANFGQAFWLKPGLTNPISVFIVK